MKSGNYTLVLDRHFFPSRLLCDMENRKLVTFIDSAVDGDHFPRIGKTAT
jgi:hypothetical protein